MQRLCYVECGGYHTPSPLYQTNRPYFGEPGERLCIQLCKPINKKISITELNKNGVKTAEVDRLYFGAENTFDRSQVAGTSRNCLKYFIEKPTTTTKGGPVFKNDLKFRLLKDKRRKNTQTFKITDLSSLLLTEYIPPTENNEEETEENVAGPSSAKNVKVDEEKLDTTGENKIYCVLQTRKKKASAWTTASDDCKSDTREPNGLRCSCVFCWNFKTPNRELHLWKQMCTVLPTEIVMNVLKFMHYDQVSWLCDKDETFTRSLAFHRYGIFDSYDRNKFPDSGSVIRLLRHKNAMEMRFSGNEGLWICTVGADGGFSFPYGTCRRYRVKEGTYTWQKFATMTTMKFDSLRCSCHQCIMLLSNLKEAMGENQTLIMMEPSRCKVFALKGSEDVPLIAEYTSVFWNDNTTPMDFDHFVHMWTDDLDDRWLQDMRVVGQRPMNVADYVKFQNLGNFRTLVFKDPVKFFSESKTVQRVDTDLVALISSVDSEVLGYLVKEKEYRLRVPANEEHRSIQQTIGLNFLPDCLIREISATNVLVRHIYSHDIDFTMNSLKNEAVKLRFELDKSPANSEALKQQLEHIYIRLANLNSIVLRGCVLTRTGVHRESPSDNTLHVHETFVGDFEFCTRYMFEPLTPFCSKKLLQGSLEFITNSGICGHNTCNINVINKEHLRACFAVAITSTRYMVN